MTVAVVTGGSRGSGRAIAEELARRGHAVVVNYAHAAAAADEVVASIRAAGGQALAVQADVTQATAIEALFETELGAPDVLVANAGVARDTLLGASEPADFDAVLAVNLIGVVNACRAAARRMIARRRGAGSRGARWPAPPPPRRRRGRSRPASR